MGVEEDIVGGEGVVALVTEVEGFTGEVEVEDDVVGNEGVVVVVTFVKGVTGDVGVE